MVATFFVAESVKALTVTFQGGPEDLAILAVDASAVNVLAVNRPLPLYVYSTA